MISDNYDDYYDDDSDIMEAGYDEIEEEEMKSYHFQEMPTMRSKELVRNKARSL